MGLALLNPRSRSKYNNSTHCRSSWKAGRSGGRRRGEPFGGRGGWAFRRRKGFVCLVITICKKKRGGGLGSSGFIIRIHQFTSLLFQIKIFPPWLLYEFDV